MADLSVDFCGIKSPNPFWLASAPPTNTGAQIMRAFDAGWGGAVWKTLGNPIVNVSSRFGGIDYGSTRMMGLNNIELITDRPLDVNLKEITEVKKRYPKHVVIASLMVETKEEWREIIQKAEDAGADGETPKNGMTDLVSRDVHCRQSRIAEFRQLDVVKTGHGNIAGNPKPAIPQFQQSPHGHDVIDADNRRGQRAGGQKVRGGAPSTFQTVGI